MAQLQKSPRGFDAGIHINYLTDLRALTVTAPPLTNRNFVAAGTFYRGNIINSYCPRLRQVLMQTAIYIGYHAV